MGRLILFDKRGTGLSDRLTPDRLADLETRINDVRAVMDAAGSERVVLVGVSEGSPMSVLFAATHPERALGLVLIGTGMLAVFDAPARAVRCAWTIARGVRALGIEVRAGLHTGEAKLVDGEVRGVTVHIGARVAALAAPSEVLVSQTVSDLVAGSGLELMDRGVHRLAGVSGEWRLQAARDPFTGISA